MDSMRSLNTSLPRTSPRRRAAGQQTPEALLSAFKAAALSVTTLYKTAASDQTRSRAAGYQDALDDLLLFLDKKNLGLDDGEGWRVRQWATERLDGSIPARADSDDEEDEVVEEGRSSSPEVARKATSTEDSSTSNEQSLPQEEPEPEPIPPPQSIPQQQPQQHATDFAMPQTNNFTFRSPHQYPSNHDREVNMDNASVTSETPSHGTATDNAPTPVRVELVPRSSRPRHNRSNNARSTGSGAGSLGSGAGAKRKTPFGDFFDISGLSFEGKDSSGRGGKRGRHT